MKSNLKSLYLSLLLMLIAPLSAYAEEKKHRLNLLAHVNQDFRVIGNIIALEAIYAYPLKSSWLEFFLQEVQGNFSEMAHAITPLGTNDQEQAESKNTLFVFGGGFMDEGTWVQDLFDDKNLFTSASANLGFYILDDELTGKQFTGPGIKIDFGLYRRRQVKMHYGLKVNYHLAKVTNSSSKMLLSWLSFGFDLGFYF